MKNSILALAALLTSGCALSPDFRETEVKGYATSQFAGDVSHSVNGKKKPNAILCIAGLETPTKGHWNNLEIVYLVEHYSLCNTAKDRGEERIGVGFVWSPFK